MSFVQSEHDVIISRTFDSDYIEKVCKHPKVWKHISSDDSDINKWKPCVSDGVYWLIPHIDGGNGGVFLILPRTTICFEIHTCILPEFWGIRTRNAARAAISYVFSNTKCSKLITNVPVINTLARRLAERSGMKLDYVDKKSILKDGIAMDQYVLSIYKEDVLCQQQQQ